MADTKVKYEFDAAERAWLRISIQNQIKMLQRARTKEVVGGDVHALRGREIDALNILAQKVA